jgi:NAD-specific glutamate dehydrogenase
LREGFTQAAKRSGAGCQIAQLRYADGRGGMATALLILNDDMPYLVDSIVMAMRKQRVAVNGVMNAVLAVRRDAEGTAVAVGEAGAPLESYVLCLLAEDLAPTNWPRWWPSCRWWRATPPWCAATLSPWPTASPPWPRRRRARQ